MLLVRPIHSIAFLAKYNLGVEAHIGRYDRRPGWEQYVPFVHGVHLPYSGCNLAAIDDSLRTASIEATMQAIDTGRRYPVDRMVMHSMDIESEEGQCVGEYDRLVQSLRQIAQYAAQFSITLCIENNRIQYDGQIQKLTRSADQWYQLHSDVNESNVMLCLDTSHAATSVMTYDRIADREAALTRFLMHPEIIGRVHWSDSTISTDEGKQDLHWVPGTGDLPISLHQAIDQLPVTKLLEQNCTEEDVIGGLEFIRLLG